MNHQFPFLTFSIGCWLPLPYVTDALSVLIAYAAVILSFMGAIHWGAAMSSTGNKRKQYFLVSVSPALVAWVALMTPAVPSLTIFYLVLSCCICMTVQSKNRKIFPHGIYR